MSKKVKKDILTTYNSLTYSYFKIEGLREHHPIQQGLRLNKE